MLKSQRRHLRHKKSNTRTTKLPSQHHTTRSSTNPLTTNHSQHSTQPLHGQKRHNSTRQQQQLRQQQFQQQLQQQQQPKVKRVHQQRLAKTGIVGAGPTGLTIARVAQVMGYQSPITLIDQVAPVRVDANNLKRNHPLLLTSASLDSLAQLDPRLYRRLLSLGRFDTFSGYLNWSDKPSRMLSPKDSPNSPFPRWINHLCLPRDAYGFAVLTTPLFDLPKAYKELMRKALDDPTIQVPPLPQVGINVGKIVEVTTPLQDPMFKQTSVPIVRLVPQTVHAARLKAQRLKREVEMYGGIDGDDDGDDDDDADDEDDARGDDNGINRGNNSIDDDHDDDNEGFEYKTNHRGRAWNDSRRLDRNNDQNDDNNNNNNFDSIFDNDNPTTTQNKTTTKPLRQRTMDKRSKKDRKQTLQARNEQIKNLTTASNKLQDALEFNLVIAADGLTSDLFKFQYKTANNYSRLLPSPTNDIRVHGWTRSTELKHLIGQSIGDVEFDTFDDAYRRINSRIWTRKSHDGIRFTPILMDYAPLHLTNDVTYRPKESDELPDWIYWELLVNEAIWKKETKLPVPILPATNNSEITQLREQYQRNTGNIVNKDENEQIDVLLGTVGQRGIEDGVMMYVDGPPIKPIDLLQLTQLSTHPLIKVLIAQSDPRGLTVEKPMYNPIEHNLKNKSTFRDHIVYAGSSAFGSISDSLVADTLNLDHAIITALSLASNNTNRQNGSPELLARHVSNHIDKAYFHRATVTQQRILNDNIYHGEPNKLNQYLGTLIDQYFPPPQASQQYEWLYRYNPLHAYETVTREVVHDILQRNKHYRDSVLSGFLDGETRQIDFGDIPLDSINLHNSIIPQSKHSASPFLPPPGRGSNSAPAALGGSAPPPPPPPPRGRY